MNNKNIRSATKMERARAKAVGWSAFLLVLMLTVTVAFVAIVLDRGSQNPNPPGPGGEVGGPIAFGMPVSGTINVIKEYSDSELQYNQTAKRWEGHKAYDIGATLGTSILATYAGTVTSVVNNSMWGTVVTIEHRDGLKTVYSGLDKNVLVSSGDTVTKGQRIGSMGNTAAIEEKDSPHVHLEVFKDGKKVNPADYISFTGK